MSRAALWRQEASLKERERQATEAFQNALEEGRNRSQKGLVPLRDTTTFNLNPMLLGNISKSGYFVKCCNQIRDWSALVDEIYYHVTHLEPWTPENQMKLMLDHVDSPYIRCIGFLYLRYAADPGIIWKSFQPYLYDREPVKIGANVNSKERTVGEFVRGLLTDLDFYGTRLPRLPMGIEREIKVKLLQEEEIEQRADKHFNDSKVMEYFEKIGSRVQAMYGDEENEVAWYDAVVDRVIRKDDDTGVQFHRPKFIVTFPEYGNTEVVSLGEMDMPGVVDHILDVHRGTLGDARKGSNGASYRHGKYDYDDPPRDYKSRHESRCDERQNPRRSPGYGRRERDSYRERGYRHDFDRGQSRSRDLYRKHDEDHHHHRYRSRSRDRSIPNHEKELYRADIRKNPEKSTLAEGDSVMSTKIQTNSENEDVESKPSTKTPEQLAALAEKKRKLLAKYG